MKVRQIPFPQNDLISPRLPADYSDAFEGVFSSAGKISADDAMIAFWTQSPGWVDGLFALRDRLVKPFSIQPGSGRSKEKLAEAVRAGGSYGLMEVVGKSDCETVISLTDRHLKMYFAIKVSGCGPRERRLTFSTVVHFRNFFGIVYFYAIYPAHCVVVPRMIKHSLKSIAARTSAP